jgi:transposase
MTVNERETHWRGVLVRQEKSGLSVRAFCRQESLCEQTLYAWRRRLAQRNPVSFALVKFRPEVPAVGAAVELVLAGGERLHIAAGVDITTLRTVLAAVRERA